MEILQEQFNTLLKKGPSSPSLLAIGPGFFSRIFTVPKKSGVFCPLTDLKALNEVLKPKRFKMESADSIRATLPPKMWTYSIDLKDSYFQIPLHPKSRKFPYVSFKGQIYQFRALPFGLSSAHWLFTMLARTFACLIHTHNMALHQFLDNWLGRAMSREYYPKHRDLVILLCDELGWIAVWRN